MKYNNAPLTERKIVFWGLVAFFVSLFISYQVEAATMTDLILAIEKVESNGNASAYNESEKALGSLQIRPIMVEDYNRIYGTSLKHEQMSNRLTSHDVAIGIFHHYGKSVERNGETLNAKHLAFVWNGGGSAWKRVANPKNDEKQRKLEIYWTKVSKYLN